MNKEQLDELVNGIVNIEKDTMRKRFDIQSGKGVQYARAKADVDAVNGILNYIDKFIRFLYNGIIIKHQKTEPTYTKTSLFLCEKRRFFMARREKGVVPIIYFEKERGKSF